MPPKFDMQAAREICGQLPKYIMGVCPSKEEAEAAKLLPAALDEIERQNASLDDAEALTKKNAEMLNAQAKRIAELERSEKLVIQQYEWQVKWSCKQRAALKILGKRSAKRGKALVEERAKDDSKFPELCDIVHDELMCPALDGDCEHWEGCPRKDELRQKARQQLRAEGLL